MHELKDRQYRLNVELDEYTKADHQYHIHVSTAINLSRNMKEIFESSELLEKRAILNYLLQNPTVSGKTLHYTLRNPFNTVLELANCPNWLAWNQKIRTLNWEDLFEYPNVSFQQISKLLSLI